MVKSIAVLIGFGNVGKELAKILLRQGEDLGIELAAISASRGSVLVEGPADRVNLHKIIEAGEKLDKHPMFREGLNPIEAVDSVGADLAFIAIPPSYESGEPNNTLYRSLVEMETSIVTADKTVLALDYKGFMDYAKKHRVFIGYRATVMAGTPALDAARGLRLRPVERIQAVLNATTNYILSLVEKGLSYEEAVARAIEYKLAEPDPTVDTHGYDAAAKLAILSSTLGYSLRLPEIERIPLETISEEEVRKALRGGKRVKHVAIADYERKEYVVKPVVLDTGDPLAQAEGEGNVAVFELEGSRIVLSGPAGPAWRTARVMITDALEYLELRDLLVK